MALSLTIGACGEGGDGDGGPTGSGVEGNKPLSALTAEEIGALCDWRHPSTAVTAGRCRAVTG